MAHWIFRVNDGNNFRNSNYPFWGVKRGKNGCMKTIISKIKPGDILWFMTSKAYGGKLIAVSEYSGFYDRNDEPLFLINTKTNQEQCWRGDDLWDIQIHYSNLYITENQNITACIQCGSNILEYETFKNKISSDLYEHYKNYKFYSEPKVFKSAL